MHTEMTAVSFCTYACSVPKRRDVTFERAGKHGSKTKDAGGRGVGVHHGCFRLSNIIKTGN